VSQDLTTWLAEMPPEHEIDAKIAEIEGQLELLRAMKQLQSRRLGSNGAVDAPSKAQAIPSEALLKRLSPERVEILRAILDRPAGQASIPDVVARVKGDRNNTASNMQRMISADLLNRVGRGMYQLSEGALELMQQLSEQGEDGGLFG